MSFWNGREWVGDAPPAADVKPGGRAKRGARALLEAGLITALTFGVIVGSTFAARGGKPSGGGGTSGGALTGPVLVKDANADGAANFLDDVTFNVSSSNARPFVGLRCYQGSN